MEENEFSLNTSDHESVEKKNEDERDEPSNKRLKTETPLKGHEKLELRLGGILCCAVCLDLPRAAVYQCTNGHLMCAGCFTHLLADARLRDETATCPNCRVEISRSQASRNLAVEKAISELPASCQFCSIEYPRNLLNTHQKEFCSERPCQCKYSRIGCPWKGPFHEGYNHEQFCQHPLKTGAEIMDALAFIDAKLNEEKYLNDLIFELLSVEKISLLDLQLKPYRTDDFIQKLFYETSRFSAFGQQWVAKARINDSQRDPTQSCERNMSYQILLKTKNSTPIKIQYLTLRGPFGDVSMEPKIYCHEFTEDNCETSYQLLPLRDSAECNRLLAGKIINFRQENEKMQTKL